MFEQHKTRSEIELQTSHPYLFRSTQDQTICEEYIDNNQDDEIVVKIPFTHKGSTRYLGILKKQLIAEHFIPNSDPETFRFVLYHDSNKLNLSPSNLYWVSSAKVPQRKVQRREYIDSLPPDAIQVEEFNNYKFDHYHYSPSLRSAFLTTRSGRIQKVSVTKRGNIHLMTFQDTDNISRSISLNRMIAHFQN